jgi:hypothetical protein
VNDNGPTLKSIRLRRTRTEHQLASALQRTTIVATVQDLKNLVLSLDTPDFGSYVKLMMRLLESAEMDADESVPLIEDTWNYFPHHSLNGRCPAEIMMQNTRDIKS